MSNNVILKPLIHPKCFYDEFPTGYLIRIADLNKYSGASWLFHEDFKLRNAKSANYFYDFLVNIEWTGFRNNNYIDFSSIQPTYFEMKRMKFCPLCLNESPYIRTKWQLRPSMVCRTHRVWLRDTCSSCGNPITMMSSKIVRCECGQMIINQELLIASPEMIKMQEFIEGDFTINEKFKDDMESRLNLIMFFNRWLKFRGQIYGLSTCDIARNTLEDSAEALFSGKSGFMNFLKRLSLVDKKDTLFKRFYKEFYENFNTENFSTFRNFIEEYVNKNWERPLTKRHSLFSEKTVEEHPWIPLSVASRSYDLPKGILKKAFSNGYIRFKKEVKQKRTLIYLYKPDIDNRYFRIKDIITAKEARLILGLTKLQFVQMVNGNTFKTAISPRESGLSTWCFSSDEITALKNKITSGLPDNGGVTWSFSEIMKYFSGRLENFLILFSKSIENDEIKPASIDIRKNGYSSLNFLKDDFIAWFEVKKNNEDLLSIPSIAKILGVNQQFVYELVNYGCIKTVSKDQINWVNKSSLDNFHNKYVILSKLSKASNLNSRTLISYLASRAIYPVDHYKDYKLRQKIYFKDHLINISILNTMFNP